LLLFVIGWNNLFCSIKLELANVAVFIVEFVKVDVVVVDDEYVIGL